MHMQFALFCFPFSQGHTMFLQKKYNEVILVADNRMVRNQQTRESYCSMLGMKTGYICIKTLNVYFIKSES